MLVILGAVLLGVIAPGRVSKGKTGPKGSARLRAMNGHIQKSVNAP